MDAYVDAEGKKWVISGRSSLKPIFTGSGRGKDFEDEEEHCTTPTSEEARIPSRFVCPPPPKKRKPTSACQFNGVRVFFNPPDLETVFIRLAEKA